MGSAAISYGPKLGLLNNAAIGETYYDQLRPFLRGMDALVQASVLSTTTVTPPSSPNNGDAYLLPTSGLSGAWSGQRGNIAVWSTQITATGGNTLTPGWDFYTPKTGWVIYASDLAELIYYSGTAWAPVSSGSGSGNATEIQSVPVSSTAPTSGQVLEYTGSEWQPTTPSTGSNATEIQGVSVSETAPTTGQILEYNGSEWAPATSSGGSAVVDILSPDKPTGTTAYQKNEWLSVAAGATQNLLTDTSGDGYVDSLFLALENFASTSVGPTLSINIYYDGEETPTVSVPIYNFFTSVYAVSGYESLSYFANRFIGFNSPASTKAAYYFKMPIPYTGSIRIDLVNTGSDAITLWSIAEYQKGVANTWPNTRKLRVATYNESGVEMNSVNTLVNYAGGPGRLVGMWFLEDETLGDVSPKPASLEGNFRLYLDAATAVWAPSTAFTVGQTIIDSNGNRQTVWHHNR